ncbi:hypothetical protein JCGZ_11056 [Jatropha curcas]|uniref:Uncharacterized protein n=1 Tax=Jatropha curcas TaxID=180498 RepID=A0A067KE44_JATCU|nr:hypothetical protein JCGZ_11056 [Jatropha curcas]
MDQTLLYLPFLVFLPIVFIFFKKICFPPSKQCRLPPGPRPWPIVGNIPHIGKKLHISLTNIAKVHGPLISLRLGTQLVIVGSSSKAAIEILKHNDRLLSARSIPKAVPRKSHVLERLALELFSAGVDTTTTTVEWAIAELLKNKQAMKTLQQELETEINRNPIQESQVSQLLYLNACVKETLRLHPPAPFLLPHCATEACELMNFVVPKNTRVLVNVWAIARDPLIWEDSELFKPERFLHSGLDFKSQNFDFLPFGSGRRICPGLPMAIRQLPMILASLIHHFDWSLPNGEDPALLDMTDKFGITLQKEQPLFIVPKRK